MFSHRLPSPTTMLTRTSHQRYRPLRRPSKLVVLGGNARDCRSESEEDSNRRQSYSKDVAASMDVATSSSPSSVATSRGPPTALSAAPIKPPSPLPSHIPALAGAPSASCFRRSAPATVPPHHRPALYSGGILPPAAVAGSLSPPSTSPTTSTFSAPPPPYSRAATAAPRCLSDDGNKLGAAGGVRFATDRPSISTAFASFELPRPRMTMIRKTRTDSTRAPNSAKAPLARQHKWCFDCYHLHLSPIPPLLDARPLVGRRRTSADSLPLLICVARPHELRADRREGWQNEAQVNCDGERTPEARTGDEADSSAGAASASANS
ncbi:hypothetical protein BJ912DRAFT_1140727 [Pholiota molesta]|nr:hypothetical protein BJ912DRAFT_1140727 [Pholiota molesta]